MGEEKQLQLMDVLNLLSFVIGVKNYNETIGQNELQEILNVIVSDIHEHLKEQDKKIDYLISVLEKEG